MNINNQPISGYFKRQSKTNHLWARALATGSTLSFILPTRPRRTFVLPIRTLLLSIHPLPSLLLTPQYPRFLLSRHFLIICFSNVLHSSETPQTQAQNAQRTYLRHSLSHWRLLCHFRFRSPIRKVIPPHPLRLTPQPPVECTRRPWIRIRKNDHSLPPVITVVVMITQQGRGFLHL
ncbi:hypothetical protein EV361DRAFT_914881 [Lentinula raphanica]|nr:hypothetical protein EV361DRAFT_914881 [Lentinula raphanica]